MPIYILHVTIYIHHVQFASKQVKARQYRLMLTIRSPSIAFKAFQFFQLFKLSLSVSIWITHRLTENKALNFSLKQQQAGLSLLSEFYRNTAEHFNEIIRYDNYGALLPLFVLAYLGYVTIKYQRSCSQLRKIICTKIKSTLSKK